MHLEHFPLANAFVRLEPIAPEHEAGLAAAAADPALFAFWPRGDMSADFARHFADMLEAQATGWMLYTVIAPGGEIVGQTGFLNYQPEHARVEIGHTWYRASVHGTKINPAAKLLMFGHAFAAGAGRVELKVDARNARSRAAVLKLGAVFEGIHRKDRRIATGFIRDTAWYSVLPEEWPEVKAGLEARLAG
jgi:RimJ/RimL family protein N-acetyltransferase